MKIFIGADHAGFELKTQLADHLSHLGHEVVDLGAPSLDANDDFPQYAYSVATKVLGEEGDTGRGILICGSGQGVCMASNRVRGIRASVVWNEDMARETRQDNDSNVLCLAARFLEPDMAMAITDAWIQADFSKAERHQRRIDQIEELYG